MSDRSGKRAGIINKERDRSGRRRKEPLDVSLTVKMNFGSQPGDAITVIEDRRVPLVGSVFENRDRIAKGFLRLILKASARNPRVIRELLLVRLLRRR